GTVAAGRELGRLGTVPRSGAYPVSGLAVVLAPAAVYPLRADAHQRRIRAPDPAFRTSAARVARTVSSSDGLVRGTLVRRTSLRVGRLSLLPCFGRGDTGVG